MNTNSLNKSLNHYLNKFSPDKKRATLKEIKQIIQDNNTVASTLESHSYKSLVKKIRAQLPDIFTGEITCVDGRLPSLITHLPKITRTWKEPAAEAVSSNFEDRLPTRLAIAIKSHFDKYTSKNLIEFVQAHTSLNYQKDHGCGAVKLALQSKGPNFEKDGGLAWNIRQLKNTTVSALRNQAGKNTKLLTCIIEVLDTDTGGIIFGLENYANSPLPTQKITELAHESKIISTEIIANRFHKTIQSVNKFSNNFTQLLDKPPEVHKIYKLLTDTIQELTKHKELYNEIIKILTNIYPKLPKNVVTMMTYRLLHNISFGLLTGFFTTPSKNTFNHHHERYISIGEVGIGDEVVSSQAFRVNHTGFKQITQDLTIMLDLMNKIGEMPTPYIVFLVEPVNKKLYLEDPHQQTLQRVRTQLAKIRRVILSNQVLARRQINGEFILLPTIVEEKNQEILEIPLFY